MPTKNGGALYNSRSGSLISLTIQQFDILRQLFSLPNISIQSALYELVKTHLGKSLIDAKAIISSDEDELQELKLLEADRRKEKDRLNLVVVLTVKCNMGCTYCYQQQHGFINTTIPLFDKKNELDNALLLFIQKQIPQKKSLNIKWYGGEPLLEWPRLLKLSEEFIEICNKYDCKYGAAIQTSGYLLTEERAKKLAELQIKKAEITLDGAKDTHDKQRPIINGAGSFDQIFKNLIKACDYIDKVILRMNLASNNIESAYNLMDIVSSINKQNLFIKFSNIEGRPDLEFVGIKKMKFRDFSLKVADLSAYARKKGLNLDDPIPIPNPIKCPAINDDFFIFDSSGYVHKCYQEIGDNKYSIGRLSNHGEISTNNYLKYWKDFTVFDDPVCRKCYFLPVCMGGCPYNGIVKKMKEDGDSTFFREEDCIKWKFNLKQTLKNILGEDDLITTQEFKRLTERKNVTNYPSTIKE